MGKYGWYKFDKQQKRQKALLHQIYSIKIW